MAAGRLVGRAAIVTGGSSGIGRSVCQMFAKEGASVAIVDLKSDGMNETLSSLPSDHGNKHCVISANVSKAEDAKESVRAAEEKLGQRSSILVNSAGITRDALLLKMTEESFDEVINVNLKGTFLMAKEFVISLQRPNTNLPGSIINLSSIVGKTGNIGQTSYAASKTAVLGMTKTIAREYGKHNIRCNAVLPGFIRTAMTESVPPTFLEIIIKQTPLGRMGTPEEVANACLFLASDESSFVNGACLEVTGGLSA